MKKGIAPWRASSDCKGHSVELATYRESPAAVSGMNSENQTI